jgi:hypothetical protein
MRRSIELSDRETQTIVSALHLAARQYRESAAEFAKVAAHVRAGNAFSMFAEGEPGALAADRLAEQFTSQAEDATALAERFECAEGVSLRVDEEEERAC